MFTKANMQHDKQQDDNKTGCNSLLKHTVCTLNVSLSDTVLKNLMYMNKSCTSKVEYQNLFSPFLLIPPKMSQ